MLYFRNTLRTLRSYFFVFFLTLVMVMPLIMVHAQTGANPGGISGGSNPGGILGGSNPAGTPGGTNPGTALTNPLQSSTIQALLGNVLTAIVTIGTAIFTIMLVYCGFLFVVAQGNEEKIREARSALVWTLIGGLILLGANAIQGIVTNTLKTL